MTKSTPYTIQTRHRRMGWGVEVAVAGVDLVVPKGSKHKEAAMKFIALATSAQGQADLANATTLLDTITAAVA